MNFLDRIIYPGIENMSDKGIPERALIADLENLPPEQQCYFRPYEYAALQLNGKVVLDLCSGTGVSTGYFAKYANRIVGLDNSKVAVRYAKDHYAKTNCTFAEGDALNIQYPRESFDCCCFFEAIEHFDSFNQQKVLSEIYAVLKPNGKVFFSTPNRELTMGNNCYHLKELNPEELWHLLEMYFGEVVIKGGTYDGVVHDEPDGCPILFGGCER
jgi:SAM-dependent methyltransferase